MEQVHSGILVIDILVCEQGSPLTLQGGEEAPSHDVIYILSW